MRELDKPDPSLNKIITDLENEVIEYEQERNLALKHIRRGKIEEIEKILKILKRFRTQVEKMLGATAYMYEASGDYDQSAEKAITEILGEKKKKINPSRRDQES